MASDGCRFCGTTLRHKFVDLGMSPLANSFLKPYQLREMEPFYPLRVYVCERCLLVQLEEYQSPAHIFSDYAYFSSYSDMFLQHAKAYADLVVERFRMGAKSYVIEIGSNDGYLLMNFVARGIPVLGIEPAKNVAEVAIQKGVPTLVTFFGSKTASELVQNGRRADLMVGNNVLAHVPDLNDFVKGLKTLLDRGGVITMEFPHLMRLMAQNQFDTIYHEHLSYFSLITVEHIFESHGLILFDVEEISTHGGSLRIYARHMEDCTKPVSPQVAALRTREEAAGFLKLEHYFSFGEKVRETKLALLESLSRAKRAGKSVVGYGAAAKGTTLLNYCGIRSDFLDYIVDRSPYKQRHFLPGTHLPIFEPDKIKETKPDYLLILSWNLMDEVMEQMSYIREWGGQFIVPIPRVTLYS
jgi:2-polyprenyl-3-methyl-5-hydroxy-6-metoxy-1,4-benzoquinol methylase